MNGVTEVYTYDDADKLLNIKVNGVVVKSFTYDMAGRTTGITDSGGSTTLSYDYEDRIVSISRPGVATNTFAYNGFGARVSKTDSSGSNTYLRASSGLIGSIVADSGATYTPGVSEKRGTTSTFYHSDIKNTVEQTSPSQTVSASKKYDAFGNEVSSQGSWQGPFQYGGAFGYHTDTDYGLKHLGHRYYDPTTARFLSRDPIGDGRNWYGYCDGNPVSNADPKGLVPFAVVVLIVAVLLIAEPVNQHEATPEQVAEAWRTTEQIFWTVLLIGSVAEIAYSLTLLVAARISAARLTGAYLEAGNKVISNQGLTAAARGLEKHGARVGSAFPKPTGSVADKNRLADQILRDILENPSKKEVKKGITKIYGQDGRGVAFNPDGSFRGWLEPPAPIYGPRLPSK